MSTKRTRLHYTDGFKSDAVQLVTESDVTKVKILAQRARLWVAPERGSQPKTDEFEVPKALFGHQSLLYDLLTLLLKHQG